MQREEKGAAVRPAATMQMIAAIALMAVAIGVVYWPALRAFLETDDFSLLAFSRILSNPLTMFVHEHFPLGPYFRPLPMTLWWFSARVFGNALMPQYALNLFLHLAVSLALWRLLTALSRNALVSWTIALLFAVHPVAIGTSLWLSDRFDLLATLFSLLALRVAHGCRDAFPRRAVILAITLVICALLSKESGIVTAAAICTLWAWPRDSSASEGTRRAGLLVVALVTAIWVVWRALVAHATLTTFVNGVASPGQLLGWGSLQWMADFGRYAGAWGRMTGTARIALACGALLLAAGLAGSMIGSSRRAATHRASRPALACAAVIFLVCLAMEAPYAYMWTVTFPGIADAAPVATYSRLFYFPLCGIAIATAVAFAALADLEVAGKRRHMKRLCGAGALLLGLAWAHASHDLANSYRRETNTNRQALSRAVDAIDALALPATRCRVFLLDLDVSGSGYMLKYMTDAVVKALAADERKVERCLIQTEVTSWENLVGGEHLTLAGALPMQPMYADHEPAAWIDLGSLQVAYLDLLPEIDAREFPGAAFLRVRDGRYENVSEQVHAGSLPVHFICARPEHQCRR